MIGILPVAGKATRIQGLPKYLLPVPGGYLLERMLSRMGVPCLIGGNPDNAALLNHYKRPEDTVYQVDSATMCETLLAARPYAGDETVLMGMPDTYWTDETVFHRLRDYLDEGYICALAVWHVSAEMASRLGVCMPIPTRNNHMIFLDNIQDKQPQVKSKWVWGAMAWTSDFWQYIRLTDVNPGVALNRALAANEPIPLHLADGEYYDNGVPEDYFRCIRELTGVAV